MTSDAYREWRTKNRDKLNAQSRARYARNGDALREKAAARRGTNREKFRLASQRFRERHPNSARDYYRADPVRALFDAARRRAASRGIAFGIDRGDIQIPENCPVLGVRLVVGGGQGFRDGSPTLDRVDNVKGYVKGNVRVISWRANRIKSDATLAELKALVTYLETHA